MNITAIIQARMSSKRYPGKVLHPVSDKNILQFIIERLKLIPLLSDIFVATSIEDSDLPVKKFCDDNNIRCFQGSLKDVAGRFNSLLTKFPCDAFVRVNGDSPLIDHNLISEGLSIFADGNYDLVTNILTRTYPKGQSVEVVKSKIFQKTYLKMNSPDDFEHVTKYFYKNKYKYKIKNFESKKQLENIQLSVDTYEDMRIFKGIIHKMDKPHWMYTLDDILDIYWNIV
jgi:spore coat polysaccharide biosynthesis protein SpsF (cytidylyltransferase family)